MGKAVLYLCYEKKYPYLEPNQSPDLDYALSTTRGSDSALLAPAYSNRVDALDDGGGVSGGGRD